MFEISFISNLSQNAIYRKLLLNEQPSNRHPVFAILPGAAEGDEGLQEVGEAFFPRAFAGDLGGEVRFALRGGGYGKQAGEERHLFRQIGRPRVFGAGGSDGFGGDFGFCRFFRVNRARNEVPLGDGKGRLRALVGRAQPADLAAGFFAGAFALRATRRSSRVSLSVYLRSDQP